MSEELKPCPFCGNIPKAKVEIVSMGGDSDCIHFSIVCEECGISRTIALYTKVANKFTDVEEAMEMAKEVWNRRVKSSKEYIAVELDGLKSKTVG
jgi:Lar family restriction alleviation protein